MSAHGEFTIQEQEAGGTGSTFVWTSDREPRPGREGGARACPRQPWSIPSKLRTVRTDYPGASSPTEQVLGPNYEPFTLQGVFDDRYNYGGYAVNEMRKLEAMCRRGNLCQFQYQEQVFLGLITEWEFDYRKDWDIGYRITVSNHGRTDQDDEIRSQEVLQTPDRAFDDANLKAETLAALHPNNQGIEVSDPLPAPAMSSGVYAAVTATLDRISGGMDSLAETLDTRRGALKPIGDFKRIATQFRMVGADAIALTDALVAVRSDTELAFRTALSVLDFEAWTRSVRFQSRLLMGSATKGAKDCDEREEPQAVTYYRPHKGESLYHVSRRFYGTPHAWRPIADRNHLTSMTLDGTETLTIPER